MEYMPQVRVTKEDFLALSDLAGDMSIMDYMSNVIREHVAAQQNAHADGACPHANTIKPFGRVFCPDCRNLVPAPQVA